MTKFYKKNISEFTRDENNNDDLLRFAENIIENSNNIFYEHDLEGNPIFISKQIEEVIGYNPNESNIKWHQLLTENPENKNAYLSKEKVIATLQKQPPYEVEVYSKFGKKIWLEIREAPIIKEGKVVSIAGAAIDITERKSSEKLLRDSEEKFSKLFQTSPNIIVISEIETGKFIDINDIGAKYLGYEKDELIGKTSIEIGMIKEELRKENIDLLKSQGYFSAIEKTLYKKNRETFTGLFYGQIISLSNKDYLFQTIVDITDTKRIDEALHESEKNYRLLVENQNEIIAKFDLEGKLTYVSPNYCEVFDVKYEDIIGKRYIPEVHPDDLADFNKMLEQSIKKPYDVNHEERMLTTYGWRWLSWSNKAIVEDDGSIKEIITVGRDVNKRKLSELELENSRLFNETLIDTANVMIVGLNLDGTVRIFNSRAEEITGYNKEELKSKSWFDVMIPADQRENVKRRFNRILSGGLNKTAENSIITKSGKEKIITWSNSAIESSGIIVGTLSFGIDITDKKKAERDLIISEEKFSKAFDNSPNAITISSLDDYKIIEINEFGVKSLGYNKKEIIGKTATELGILAKSDRNEIMKALEKEGYYNTLILPVKTKSGKIRIGAFYGQPIFIGDKKYLFQTINDITEQKKAEEELKYSEEKYLKTFLASPDSISLTSIKNGILVEINNGFEKIFGYSREIALGKSTIELGVWQDINDRDKCIDILKKQGYVRNYIAVYNAKDGRTGTGEISMELVVIGDEEYLLTIVRDITERIKIERELKASEEKFSTAFYASPDANAISRMRDGKIIDVNPVFEKLFEYSRDEAIGKTSAELNLYTNPEDRNRVYYLLNKAGVVRNLTVEYKSKNGKVGFTQISIDQIKIADELCLITSIRDITEQIQIQRDIEDYQKKLKSLTSEITLAEERERRRIAINLHDHLSQSLAMTKIRLTEAEKQKSEDRVYAKIGDAKNFLNNAISKSRSITYELSPPVLYDLGFSAAIRWQLDEVKKEHKIKTELKDTADKIKLNDEVRVLLFRAVVEIINNCLKHAMASKLIINISNDEQKLFVEINDDGKGFDLIEAEKNAAKNRSFGIFSIRERISYLKGSMVIDSKLNKGTSVKISIPFKNLDK